MSERQLTSDSSLLLTLEEISRLVAHSHDPSETLNNIVRLIQGRFRTDVCSVYLLEPDRGELVMAATIGLRAESVGGVRMRLDEGLTGLVAEQMKPVMVDDAFQHPRFKFFPKAGEDPYHSFLGVPLVEGGMLQCVLVVQTAQARTFSPSEVRMLVTVASQIAPLVGEAHLLEQITVVTHEESSPASVRTNTVLLRGTPLSAGIGFGEAYVVDGLEERIRSEGAYNTDRIEEKSRLTVAMEAAREEIIRQSRRISALVGEDHGAILQAQLMILQDRVIERDLTAQVESGATAESALVQTLDTYVHAFEKLANPFFQDRVYDVKDVFRRVLWHLRPHARAGVQARAKQTVLVSRDVSVMDLFSIDLDHLAGVIAEHGGPQSHAAILARSLGIPMVGQVPQAVDRIESGRPVLIDGALGQICVDPSPDEIACASSRATAETRQNSSVGASSAASHIVEPCPLPSGLPRIDSNINLLCEVAPALAQGAAGVGLYRTEFLFLARRTLPTEEEQVGTYSKLLRMLSGRPANIRTFDLRPDKMVHGSHLKASTTGPLDWRLVLDSPVLQQLFRDQVRAILRAALVGPARILVPLVTRSEQLDFVVEVVGRARDELTRDGLEFEPRVPVGAMLEVAAATIMADRWADQVDFFALGTNDLVASALGIDRDDPAVASLGDPVHPAVLRMIDQVVTAAHAAGRPVTVCGEMASDPEGVVALAAMQLDSLSVAVHQLGPTRQVLSRVSPRILGRLRTELIQFRTAIEARKWMLDAAAGDTTAAAG